MLGQRVPPDSGTFIRGTSVPTGNFPTAVAAGDFDGDGKLDPATANTAAKTVSVPLRGGGFASRGTAASGSGPARLTFADFNADGYADLAVLINTLAGTVTPPFGTAAGTPVVGTDLAVGRRPRAIAASDFNADNRPDLATADSGSNGPWVLLYRSPIAQPATATGGILTIEKSAGPVGVGQSNGAVIVIASIGTRRLVAPAITGVVLSGASGRHAADLANRSAGSSIFPSEEASSP